MSSIVNQDFSTRLQTAIEQSTQEERGSDIDVLIGEIAETNFEKLDEEYQSDKLDKARFKKIKNGFMVASVVLAVVAIVATIAGIFFSSGVVTAGSITLALVSGMVGITASFNYLDSSIEKYMNYYRDQNVKKSRICSLKKKITNVTTLINTRIKDLQHIEKAKQQERGSEILDQIETVNGYIKQIKKNVPAKIMKFDVINASALAAFAK